ncbi:hypothetical protein [Algoriphagus sp. AK58]|uniref:hypothetical protein n=1 Tax=Algoriphagus sp. AK58 TaxID=1406877 RepID=UPI00164FBC48|nr:hypothetical protein [Algoriphagus sp. AK58]MBC6368587.1 hypothetical protein [Algoriphagus sp. AK58]
MKVYLIPFLMLILFTVHSYGQEKSEPVRYNKNGSLIWISLTNGAVLGKGLLWKVSEDTLEFANLEYKNRHHYLENIETLKLHYSEIKELKTTPRAAIKKGMWTGAALGLASGLAVGLTTTKDPEPVTYQQSSQGICLLFICTGPSTYTMVEDEPKDAGIVILKTLVFTGIGALVGGILGNSAAVEEQLDGSKEKYLALVPELKSQAYWGTQKAKSK